MSDESPGFRFLLLSYTEEGPEYLALVEADGFVERYVRADRHAHTRFATTTVQAGANILELQGRFWAPRDPWPESPPDQPQLLDLAGLRAFYQARRFFIRDPQNILDAPGRQLVTWLAHGQGQWEQPLGLTALIPFRLVASGHPTK